MLQRTNSIKKQVENFKIEKTIKNSENKHLKKSFCCFFLSSHINNFINILKLVKSKQIRNGFIISNTDRSDQPGVDWSIGHAPTNAVLLFGSFGILGLKKFVISGSSKRL